MLSFVSPFWLLALVPLVVLGALTLRRQTARAMALPTLRFFPQNENASAGRSRRDWRWLLLVLALLLIPVTLAGPVWTPRMQVREPVQLHVTARAVPSGDHTDIFVRLIRPNWLAPEEGIPIIISDHEIDLTAQMMTKALCADTLEKGFIYPGPIAERIHVGLIDQYGPLAQAILVRKKSDAFAIYMNASSSQLDRVLRIQPGASSAATRRLMVVDAASGNAVPALAEGELLIALGRVSLEGIHFSKQDSLATEKIQNVARSALLDNVVFGDAQAGSIAVAELDSSWQVLAKVNGHPFLAIRQQANGSRLLWIASQLRDGNWPLQPSFVVFFTNVVSDWNANANRDTDEWEMQTEPAVQAEMPVHFSTATGIAALFCMLVGTTLLMLKK